MKSELTPQVLHKFLRKATSRLSGEWILIGGTVLPILGVFHRSTVDIDLIGKSNKEQKQILELLKLSESLGLPVEMINQAGALFLDRIESLEEDLIPLRKTKKCTIYRPDLALYLELKLARLTESDQNDCLEMIRWSLKQEPKKTHFKAKERLKKLQSKNGPKKKIDFISLCLKKLG